jgi:hypothetical protein
VGTPVVVLIQARVAGERTEQNRTDQISDQRSATSEMPNSAFNPPKDAQSPFGFLSPKSGGLESGEGCRERS